MNDRGHLSSEALDRLLLASLPDGERTAAEAHVAACPECRERWREREEDRAHFEKFVLPRTLPRIEARLEETSLPGWLRRRWQLYVPAFGLALAALAVVVIAPPSADEGYIGVKGPGAPTLEVVADRGGRQFPVRPGTHLKPGDRIRFRVNPGEARYLLIASRDGRGEVTVYFPYGGDASAQVEPGDRVLPGSIELDDATGTERLLAVFSDQPVRAADVRGVLTGGGEPGPVLGAGAQLSWEFVKDPP